MAWLDEQLSAQFHEWERRGRGWLIWPEPVHPEPPFQAFRHVIRDTPFTDDGRRPTALSSFVRRVSEKLGTTTPPLASPVAEDDELSPETLCRDSLVELQLTISPDLKMSHDGADVFLSSLSQCREPISFEVLGTTESIVMQFATHLADAPTIHRQLQAHFPDVPVTRTEGILAGTWNELDGAETAIVECGLAHEFMFPLATNGADALVPLVAALSELQPGELGLFQVLFEPIRHPWAENILESVSGMDGKPMFVNAPELLKAAQRKVATPLFSVIVRLTARSVHDRAWEIARDMASALAMFADVAGNELMPLTNEEYPFEEHVADVVLRQSRRSGMILNRDELSGFVHLPSPTVRAPKLRRQIRKSRRAPQHAIEARGLVLGLNEDAGKLLPVSLTPDERVAHMHVIGASGTGKSTFLFNLIRQDIANGAGVAVLDPHGDLVERVLTAIPPERVEDVILVDPTDEGFSVGFNILAAHSDWEKNLLASDLVSVFERLSTSWGDQMGSVLGNAIRAFLESEIGGTLADLQRFLIDPSYRTEFLRTVRDPAIVFYWQKSFPQLTGNRSIGPVLTRLDTFLGPKPIRYMVSQKENRLDFASIMNSGKILLAKLSKGMLGDANTYLLGTLLVSKLHQTAMSRQQISESQRRDFWLYIDEFHNFITPSMAEILTGARKYRLGLVLAHQDLRQLDRSREVAHAALSSTHTRVVFRVGDADARALESGFSHFEGRDLQNLSRGEAVARIGPSDADFNLTVPSPEDCEAIAVAARPEDVISASRARYAISRAEIEARLASLWSTVTVARTAKQSKSEPPAQELAPPPVSPAPSGQPQPSQSRAEAATVVPIQSAAIADLGRGGKQHQAIQLRIKDAADKLGFRATIEKPILDGQGSVDLLLERASVVIACEVSVTNTIDYEVGNVSKCLKAGFPQVAVVCLTEERLRKIAAAVEGSLGPDAANRVRYFQPDPFIDYLQTLEPPPPPPGSSPPSPAPAAPEMRRGWKIKRTQAELSPEERKAREDAALKMMAKAMRPSNK